MKNIIIEKLIKMRFVDAMYYVLVFITLGEVYNFGVLSGKGSSIIDIIGTIITILMLGVADWMFWYFHNDKELPNVWD